MTENRHTSTPAPPPPPPRALLRLDDLDALLASLRASGYELIGPTVRDGAIVHAPIDGVGDLPAGIGDEQSPGRYRLRPRDDGALFGWAVGPNAWKRELLVPVARLVRAKRGPDGERYAPEASAPRKRAFVGVRACELAAIAVQDRVLAHGPYVDDDYAARRRDLFVIAVQCGDPGGTCFCVSMGTGPRARDGFDLALTEIAGDGAHRFVVEIGSAAGAERLAAIAHAPAPPEDVARADAIVDGAATRMGRTLDTRGVRDLLFDNLEHPRWDDVASRCLACASCTMACPTCFCTTTEDRIDLEGHDAERVRRWDSCFTTSYSHVHGGSVRASTRARYRQWLVHKLASWIDQFGTSGCVGCGRCITWCPVGIDITEEVAAIRAAPLARGDAEGSR